MIPKPIMRDGPFGEPPPPKIRALMRALGGEDEAGETVTLDEETVRVAVAEGLGPPLGARVATNRILVPEDRREELSWEYHRCIADNLVRGRAVEALAGVYETHAIPLLLLKGMALIQSTFDSGQRSMVDIDVLVPPSRWREACDLARDMGYQQESLPGRTYTADHDYVCSFRTPGGVVIEIHRFVCEASIFVADYEGTNGIFARAKRLASGLLVPEEGDLFLTLVAHAAKHTFDLPLRSYLDGIVMLRGGRFSIDELAVRARGWRMETAFHAWMRCLRRLASGDEDHYPVGIGTLRQHLGRLVWSRTTHASPWQRFVRLAWLMDTRAHWMRHVATRSLLRTLDALPWSVPRTRG